MYVSNQVKKSEKTLFLSIYCWRSRLCILLFGSGMTKWLTMSHLSLHLMIILIFARFHAYLDWRFVYLLEVSRSNFFAWKCPAEAEGWGRALVAKSLLMTSIVTWAMGSKSMLGTYDPMGIDLNCKVASGPKLINKLLNKLPLISPLYN